MARPGARVLLEEQLTRSIIGSFFDVHRELGFGYREFIYGLALERALLAKGHRVAREALQLSSSRRATDLEVGVLLHFGRDPKFYRSICENRFKPRSDTIP